MSESKLSCFGSGLGRKAKLAICSSGMTRSLAASVRNDRDNEVEATGSKHRLQGHRGAQRH